MKTCIFTSVLIVMMLIFSQCSKLGNESDFGKEELSLPQSVEQLGKAVAKDLHSTVVNLHRMGVDYSDADASEAFYGRFMTDYLAASPNAAKTKGHVDFAEMTSPEVFGGDMGDCCRGTYSDRRNSCFCNNGLCRSNVTIRGYSM